MYIQIARVLYSGVITWQSIPAISQFNSPCNEFTSFWLMFVYTISQPNTKDNVIQIYKGFFTFRPTSIIQYRILQALLSDLFFRRILNVYFMTTANILVYGYILNYKDPGVFLFNSCAKLLSVHVLDLFLMNIRANPTYCACAKQFA
mgnify:CR=1 FL=1